VKHKHSVCPLPLLTQCLVWLAAFIWGGDAVYGDRVNGWEFTAGGLHPNRSCATYDRLLTMYDKVLGEPFYPISDQTYHFGTIDDHDLGCNNGGKWFELAKNNMAGRAFIDHFIDASNKPYFAGLNETYDKLDDPVYLRAIGAEQASGSGVFVSLQRVRVTLTHL